MWLSGGVPAQGVQGPGFSPQPSKINVPEEKYLPVLKI